MDIYNETPQQKDIADYNIYLQLKNINYSNIDIAKHLSYTTKQLGYLISSYSFKNNLEYELQEKQGDYHFNGKFYITQSIQNILTTEEILEIYTFTKELVLQHQGIDYLQSFYHVDQDCKLFFIDQLSKQTLDCNNFSKEDNYCTLMLASDY